MDVAARRWRAPMAGFYVVALLLTSRQAFALPGDPDEPAIGPHEILDAERPSGRYWFDPDGAGGLEPFQGHYTIAAGGGWLQVLNYVHLGGTNPSLTPRSTDLPLQQQGELGTDQSDSIFWGHATPELLAKLNVSELRFLAITSAHERRIDFITSNPGVIDYVTTGEGSMEGIETFGISLFGGHTALLPGSTTSFGADRGQKALTEFPFFQSDCCAWTIRGGGQQWEVDDNHGGFEHDTIHRVFIRTAILCGDGLVRPDEGCDDGNAESGDGCSSRCRAEHGYECEGAPSSCLSTCGDGLVARDEQCDDENLMAGDGCSASCIEEEGSACWGEPSLCEPSTDWTRCGQGPCDAGSTQSRGCTASSSIQFRQTPAGLLLLLALWLTRRNKRRPLR